MAFFLIFLPLFHSAIITVDKYFKGPHIFELSKSPMYKNQEIYGNFNSSIKVYCISHIGTPSESKGYISIIPSDNYSDFLDYSKLSNSSLCNYLESFSYNLAPISSEYLEYNITETDTYYTCLVLCTDSKIYLKATVKSLNPYGYVPADLFPLIPFYFLATSTYLIMLLIWVCRLCLHYPDSISIQRYWIPCVLILCVLENFFDLGSWLSLNSTGFRNNTTQMTAITLKSIKDSFGRILLMAASKGMGIMQNTSESSNSALYSIGIFYFFFDLVYQIPLKINHNLDLFFLLVLSFPLIALNTGIFYLIFSWFSKTFFRLKFYKQVYKLKLLKAFAIVLGLGGLVSLVCSILEVLARFFWKKQVWWANWLYYAVWDLIFFFVVCSFLVIWRVNSNSKLLADTQELRDEDHEISHEDEGKFGIELHRSHQRN